MEHMKTARTTVKRKSSRARYDRDLLYQIIQEAIIGHLAFYDGANVHSIPMPFWRDGDYLYLHCSVESRLTMLAKMPQEVCISFTILDGLVFAKSAFSHSMNYRSAVVYGQFQLVPDAQDKFNAMRKFMEFFDKERWHIARQPNQKELNATAVLRIPLEEAVVKVREGAPIDKEADQKLDVWTGIIPYYRVIGAPIPA